MRGRELLELLTQCEEGEEWWCNGSIEEPDGVSLSLLHQWHCYIRWSMEKEAVLWNVRLIPPLIAFVYTRVVFVQACIVRYYKW